MLVRGARLAVYTCVESVNKAFYICQLGIGRVVTSSVFVWTNWIVSDRLKINAQISEDGKRGYGYEYAAERGFGC